MESRPNGAKLEVTVTHIIPAAIMGSGLGANQVNSGDYDIQLFDEAVVEQYGRGSLRLGDLVRSLTQTIRLAEFTVKVQYRLE